MKHIIHLLLITGFCFANAMAMESETAGTDTNIETDSSLSFQEGDDGNITVIGSEGEPLGTLSNNSAKRPREDGTALENQLKSSKQRTETQSTPKPKKRLSKLNTLSIRRCENLTDKSIQHLANARGLNIFTATNMNITDDAVKTILLNCRWLQQLNLQNCCQITGSCFKNMQHKNLKSLNLYRTNITDDAVRTILLNCHWLQELNLRKCYQITGSCFENMQHKNLRILNLIETNNAYNNDFKTLISNNPHIKFYVDQDIILSLLTDGFFTNASIISRIIDDYGCTALHFAVVYSKTDTVKSLLDAGANIEAKGEYGQTPLPMAVMRGCTDIVLLLLYAGANIDATNKYGYTALHYAAKDGRTEIVTLLLGAGANKDVINNEGETALMIAQRNNHHQIVELLEKQQ